MKKEINILYYCPDILNLHGDRGNILSFKKVGKEMGLEVNIITISNPNEKLDFSLYDIILLSPGELKAAKSIVPLLSPYSEEIKRFIKEKYIFVIGTSGSIFANNINYLDKTTIKGLSILDMDVNERSWVYGDDLIFNCEINGTKIEVVGSQIQTADFIIKNDNDAFGNIIYGYGNNKNQFEGLKKDKLIFTNCLGPIFIKNPKLIFEAFKDICKIKGFEAINTSLDFSLEDESNWALKEFILTKKM